MCSSDEVKWNETRMLEKLLKKNQKGNENLLIYILHVTLLHGDLTNSDEENSFAASKFR